MNNLERKFGRYAIKNLSLALILCYGCGYLIYAINKEFLNYLTLNPYAILHGQIWRLITWLIVPPDTSNIFFVLIMLFFYYSIGTALERTWGTWRYNVYIFSGILFTAAGSFLMMGMAYLFYGSTIAAYGADMFFATYAAVFSTYYVNMSIFLAYAVTFPDMQVLFMFIIPVKVKYLGIIYAVFLGVEAVQSNFAVRIAIVASLLNFLLLWLRSRDWNRINPREVKRRQDFKRAVQNRGKTARPAPGNGASGTAQAAPMRQKNSYPGGALHRCAVCGRTELTNPELEFRYCSKCEGNYEYCTDHIWTHIHVKNGDRSSFDANGNVKIRPMEP
jgi:hypothetical protein